jgi:hypothetical protein
MDLSAIGQQFGLTEEQTRAAFDALTPVVASGVRRSAQSENGLQDILSSALNGNHAGDATSGNDVLGQIFGSKDVSRGVANNSQPHRASEPPSLNNSSPSLPPSSWARSPRKWAAVASHQAVAAWVIFSEIFWAAAASNKRHSHKAAGLKIF